MNLRPADAQLSPKQAATIWQLAGLAHLGSTEAMHDLRRELAALSPHWADLVQREKASDE